MWKWLVFLLLLKNILSHATDPENVRETRQLNFDECCPCPTNRDYDQNTLESRKEVSSRDDCPCRNTPDSEGASSMLRPMFRAVEPSVRPADSKGDLKLLLKPEVGLASSVLETLQEVTDEEYREAVLRDAARNELNAMESNSFQKENAPRNLVNIILQPKDNNINDIMPQESNIQPSSYIYPPVSPRSYLDESRSQSLKLFREALPLTKLANKGILPKQVLDMENSASNIQEHLFQPLRTNLFEDLKLKSDMLKYKLFPNTRNGLRGAQQSFYRENKNIRGPECDNFEMPSLLDHFKKSKERSSLPNSSPVLIIEKPYEGNSMSSTTTSENRSRINVPKSPIFEMPSDVDTTFIETPDSVPNNDKPITNIILEEPKATENIACSINLRESQQTDGFENNDDTQTDDAALSPSEINETTSLETTHEPKNDVNDESNISSRENINTGTNQIQDANQLLSEEVIPSNIKEFSDKEYVDVNENIEDSVGDYTTNNENEEMSCNIKDSEVDASSNNFYSTGSQENISSIVNNPDNNDNKIPIVEDALSGKEDIKNNILKRIDNFKKTNQRLQEKFKSNVQDTLQYLKVKNNPLNEIDTGSPITAIDELTENDNKNINSQDVQEMSSRNFNDIEKLNKEIESANSKSTFRDNTEETEDTYIGEQHKSHDIVTKTVNNPCDDFSSTSPFPVETEIDSSNSEMLSQASSPVAGNIIQRPLNRDFLVQAKPNLDVREALENFKFSVSDIFNNKKTSTFLPLKNNDDENKSTILSMIHKDRPSSKEPLPRFNENKNIGKIHTRNYGNLPKVKQNNLDFYKARVPVPEILNTRSSVTLQKEDVGTLSRNHGTNPKFLQNFGNIQRTYNQNKVTGNDNRRSEVLGFNNQKNHNIPNVLPSALLKNLQPRNDVLKNIKDTFDESLRQPFITNQNGILSNENSENLYGTILKTNDELGEKLRAFHSELNDKISQFSQRISNVGNIPLQAQNKLKKPIHIKETISTKLKSDFRQIRPINKANGPRTPSNIGVPLKANSLQNRLSSSRRVGASRPQIQNKSSSKQTASESAKSSTITHPPKLNKEMNKTQHKKLRPFKDSKVTISFSTTTRPVLASGLKSIPRSKIGPGKSTDLKSRLLTNTLKNREKLKQDSKTLASERITSRIPFPAKTSDIPNESSQTLDLSDEITDSRSGNHFKEMITSGRNIDNSVLSKIREAVKARARNANKNNEGEISNINSDASQSASDVNEVKINDKALKENVSYKCKMICFEDKLD